MTWAREMSLVAYRRSIKADLYTHVTSSIIVSENEVISVERWKKTYVLGCTSDWLGLKSFVVSDFANSVMIQ